MSKLKLCKECGALLPCINEIGICKECDEQFEYCYYECRHKCRDRGEQREMFDKQNPDWDSKKIETGTICKQVKDLRELAEDCKCENEEDEVVRQLQYAADTIESLYEKQRWISCSERLPEESGRYIACLNNKCWCELTFEDGKWTNPYTGNVYLNVTLWKPGPDTSLD